MRLSLLFPSKGWFHIGRSFANDSCILSMIPIRDCDLWINLTWTQRFITWITSRCVWDAACHGENILVALRVMLNVTTRLYHRDSSNLEGTVKRYTAFTGGGACILRHKQNNEWAPFAACPGSLVSVTRKWDTWNMRLITAGAKITRNASRDTLAPAGGDAFAVNATCT